ncbi:MAG: T9SS type A sorting domain-containing protein [Saprospiraceae bacterium]|nr:T9SS type A sorting domain-containing protein [Saprospiraceae bacterium]
MKNILFLFLMPFLNDGLGQKNPLFETRLYFEDQMGNKDTITLGFDTSANEILNPEFGEVNLTHPFSGDLEVRAAHRSILDQAGFEGTLSKRIISKAERLENFPYPGYTCHESRNIILFVKANHFPVKIVWDSLDFVNSQECVYNSFITPDFNAEIIDPLTAWIQFPGKRFACMRRVEEFSINLNNDYRRGFFPAEYTYRMIRTFNATSADTIYGLSLFFTYEAKKSPCMYVVNNEATRPEFNGGNIFPNPVHETLHLEMKQPLNFEQIQIANAEGHILKTMQEENFGGSISVMDFPKGLYHVIIKTEGRDRLFSRFIKM